MTMCVSKCMHEDQHILWPCAGQCQVKTRHGSLPPGPPPPAGNLPHGLHGICRPLFKARAQLLLNMRLIAAAQVVLTSGLCFCSDSGSYLGAHNGDTQLVLPLLDKAHHDLQENQPYATLAVALEV